MPTNLSKKLQERGHFIADSLLSLPKDIFSFLSFFVRIVVFVLSIALLTELARVCEASRCFTHQGSRLAERLGASRNVSQGIRKDLQLLGLSVAISGKVGSVRGKVRSRVPGLFGATWAFIAELFDGTFVSDHLRAYWSGRHGQIGWVLFGHCRPKSIV
jgi:hypothetical protein